MYLLSLDFDTIASSVDWLDYSTAVLCICFSTLHIVGSFYLNFLRLFSPSILGETPLIFGNTHVFPMRLGRWSIWKGSCNLTKVWSCLIQAKTVANPCFRISEIPHECKRSHERKLKCSLRKEKLVDDMKRPYRKSSSTNGQGEKKLANTHCQKGRLKRRWKCSFEGFKTHIEKESHSDRTSFCGTSNYLYQNYHFQSYLRNSGGYWSTPVFLLELLQALLVVVTGRVMIYDTLEWFTCDLHVRIPSLC